MLGTDIDQHTHNLYLLFLHQNSKVDISMLHPVVTAYFKTRKIIMKNLFSIFQP